LRIENCVHPSYFTIDGRVIHEVSIAALAVRGLLENPEYVETARGEFLRDQAYALEGAEALALFSRDAFFRIGDDGGIRAGNNFVEEHFTIPDGVKIIRKSGFHGIECLKSLILSASVEVIEEDAFNGCRNLESVTLNFGLKSRPPCVPWYSAHGD
jgi:hypothetical protein